MFLRLVLILLMSPSMASAATWRLDPATRAAVDVGWQGGVVAVRFPELEGAI